MADAVLNPVIHYADAVAPLLDDTYWLGTDSLGWKGIKFPDLKLYQLDANTLSLETLAGGTWKNLKVGALELTGGLTLGGAITCADKAFTDVGDMTFHAGSILAAAAADTSTLLIKAGGLSGDTVITVTSLDAGDTLGLAHVTSFTADGDLDIGAHDFRAATLTVDGLTSGRVVFATTNGQLTDDADFTFATDTLTVTKIGAFQATGAIDFDSRNMTNVDIDSGTIGGVTLDGTITGGNQTLDNLGPMGIGNTAASAEDTLLYYSTTFTLTASSNRFGILGVLTIDATTTAILNTKFATSMISQTIIGASNDQNWQDAVGVRGLSAKVVTTAGATGTITGMAALYADASIDGSANNAVVTNLYGLYVTPQTLVAESNLTNCYGIYIGSQAGGATLNYAIYSAGGDWYNASNLIFGDEQSIQTGTAVDDLFNLNAYRTHGNNLDYISVIQIKNTAVENDTGLLGFFGATPVNQPGHIADPAACAANTFGHAWDGATDPTAEEGNELVADLAALKTAIDANNAVIDSILAQLAELGLQAAA